MRFSVVDTGVPLSHSTGPIGALEMQFSAEEFAALRDYLADNAGIEIPDTKKPLVEARLGRRLAALGMASCGEYLALLRSGDADEYETFINTLTTNVTSFFRESYHFDDLRTHLDGLIGAGQTRIRIWSAGCSIGAEPYSIAMVAHQALKAARPEHSASGGGREMDLKILATDIDTDALEHAHNGIYTDEQVGALPGEYATCVERFEDDWQIVDSVRRLVTFRWLNLIEPWPMSGPFDAVFCRNVVIYFDADRQRDVWSRAGDLLTVGGKLYVGHSESLGRRSDHLQLIGRTTYEKQRQAGP